MNWQPAKETTIEFDKLRQILISRFGHEYIGIKSTDKLDFALYPEFAFLAEQMLLNKNPAFLAFISAVNPVLQDSIRKIVYYDDMLAVMNHIRMLADDSLLLKTKYVRYMAELSKLQAQVAALLHRQRVLYKEIEILTSGSACHHYQMIVLLTQDIHQLMGRSQSNTGVFGLLDLAKKHFITSI